MKLCISWVLVPLVLVAAGCRGELPVVGIDKEGKEYEIMIKQNRYFSDLAGTVYDLQESAIPALDTGEARSMLGLRNIKVGLGIKGSAGLGSYWKLGGEIGFHLHFANF